MSSSTPSMIQIDARIDSFNAILKPKSKIKPAFPLSPSRFPHLTPTNLANAGFFHSPGSDEESFDTCTCFLCGLKLGGWDEDDDPFEEHMKRGQCAWAEFVCGAMIHKKLGTSWTWKTIENLPSSEESTSFRGTTYMKAWPHKARAGWIPTVDRLCEAGFIYTPSSTSPDAVMCPFCEYTVEGWEADDHPISIHRKKSPSCPFFVAEVQGDSSPQARPAAKAKRKTTKRATKAAESQESQLIEDEEASQQPEASTSQTKPLKRAPRKGRGKAAASAAEIDDGAASVAGESAVEDPSTIPKRNTRAGGRGKGRDVDMESVAESAMESVVEEPEPEPDQQSTQRSKKGTRKTAGRKTITQKSQSQTIPADSEEEDAPVRATASQPTELTSNRARRQTQKSAPMQSEAEIISAEIEQQLAAADTGKEATKSKSRSKSSRSNRSKEAKSTGAGVEDAEPSVAEMDIDTEDVQQKEVAKKAKRQGRTTKATQAVIELGEEAETDTNDAANSELATSKSKSKSSRTKERQETVKPKSSKTSKAKTSRTDSEVEEAVDEADAEIPQDQSQPSRPTSQANSRSTSSKSSKNSTKTSSAAKNPSKKGSKPSSRNETERVPEVEVEIPAVASKSKPSSRSGKESPVGSQPAPLSQLERFANIPPSSPFPNSATASGPAANDENADMTPRARPLTTSKSARQSPHVSLSRDQLEKSVTQGAVQARTVMDDILLNFVVDDMDKNLRMSLTEEQKGMTLEQLVRLEFEKRRRVMQKQGEEMIEKWEERTRQERRRIEML